MLTCERCPKKFTSKSYFNYHFTKDHKLKDLGIDESNYDQHSENPLVVEVLRVKVIIFQSVLKNCYSLMI